MSGGKGFSETGSVVTVSSTLSATLGQEIHPIIRVAHSAIDRIAVAIFHRFSCSLSGGGGGSSVQTSIGNSNSADSRSSFSLVGLD